jgi:hypothetical protein
MKQRILISIATIAFLGGSAMAGPPEVRDFKQTPAPPPILYGTGFYGAIDMGANVYQNRGGTRVFENEFGILSLLIQKMMSAFSAGSKRVTFSARVYFVRPLKGTSFITAFEVALTQLSRCRMALS